jgi:predicted enzyme related to lactoylglutathione lyase
MEMMKLFSFLLTPELSRLHPGVLSKSDRNKPSGNGTVVYINASPRIQTILDKVEQAGGKIVVHQTQIPAGLIAVIIDSERNKIGLHAEQ